METITDDEHPLFVHHELICQDGGQDRSRIWTCFWSLEEMAARSNAKEQASLKDFDSFDRSPAGGAESENFILPTYELHETSHEISER